MKSHVWSWIVLGCVSAAFVVLISETSLWTAALRYLFPGLAEVLHPRASLAVLVTEHLRMVAISSGLTVALGVPLAVFITRPGGRDFLPLVNNMTSLGQTFPPVAVLALAVPVMGFGLAPTIVALFLYGMLPVVRNGVSGLLGVPAGAIDSAQGMGMSPFQALMKVELPLSARVMIAGVRTSVIINVGTAMVGAVIGAGGLGSPVIAGLIQNNVAFVIEGALPAAMLALIADLLLSNIEALYDYPSVRG
jgi:osmoprotectant transport system permease protein